MAIGSSGSGPATCVGDREIAVFFGLLSSRQKGSMRLDEYLLSPLFASNIADFKSNRATGHKGKHDCQKSRKDINT